MSNARNRIPNIPPDAKRIARITSQRIGPPDFHLVKYKEQEILSSMLLTTAIIG